MKNCLDIKDCTVIIPSHRPELAKEAIKNIFDMAIIKHNTGYVSFSKMINDCVLECPTQIVIICNDKARPIKADVLETVDLINRGFGFVALHNFRFFGFHKDLIRRIGWFDERYMGGEYEDFDFLRRIKEADIAVYMSKEVVAVEMACSWNNNISKEFNFKKWKECVTHSERLMADEKYDYDIGGMVGTPMMSYRHSIYKSPLVPKEFAI